MDIFENKISLNKYRSTNQIWNSLGLNKAWSVGYTSKLIKDKNFKSKEEWYNYYFDSGEKRLKELNKLTKETNNIDRIKELNYYYGRTKHEISQKGSLLYSEIVKQGNPKSLTEKECQYIAFYRVVAETWNGIICRELNTIENLKNKLKERGFYDVLIIDTSAKFDYTYGIDFEIYHEGNVICGLQIKPESYLKNNILLTSVKSINDQKNKEYKVKYKRDIIYIYSDYNGDIKNKNSIEDIMQLIKKSS